MTTKTAATTTGALTVIAMAALTVAPAHAASVGDDKVHLLTTGASTVFETNGRWVLVGGDRAAYDYLTSRGVKKLDVYVAPSANPDVISAAPDIVAGFKPDAVWTPAYDEMWAGGRTAGADDAYRRLSDAALAANRSYGGENRDRRRQWHTVYRRRHPVHTLQVHGRDAGHGWWGRVRGESRVSRRQRPPDGRHASLRRHWRRRQR